VAPPTACPHFHQGSGVFAHGLFSNHLKVDQVAGSVELISGKGIRENALRRLDFLPVLHEPCTTIEQTAVELGGSR